MAEDGTKKSVSLEQMRHKDRVRRKTQAVIREQEDDLSLENFSWISAESDIMEDVRKREMDLNLRKDIQVKEHELGRETRLNEKKLLKWQKDRLKDDNLPGLD